MSTRALRRLQKDFSLKGSVPLEREVKSDDSDGTNEIPLRSNKHTNTYSILSQCQSSESSEQNNSEDEKICTGKKSNKGLIVKGEYGDEFDECTGKSPANHVAKAERDYGCGENKPNGAEHATKQKRRRRKNGNSTNITDLVTTKPDSEINQVLKDGKKKVNSSFDDVDERENSGKGRNHAAKDFHEKGKICKRRKNRKKHLDKFSEMNEDDLLDDLAAQETLARMIVNSDLESKNACESIFKISVETKFLNPANELKRIFGAKVVQTNSNWRNHHRVAKKMYSLVNVKDTWHPFSKSGLSMCRCDSLEGVNAFRFAHSNAYQKVQHMFWQAVDSYEPNNLTQILAMYPYHIDTLLQLSDICRASDDTAMAIDLIERAVFAFESSFHPMFIFASCQVSLPFKYPENRAFYITLFHHIQFVSRRGCNRTALELTKAIFCLDQETDPLACLLMIDYFALRAEEYHFLLQLYNSWKDEKNLQRLPNFEFSSALAKYHLKKEDADLSLQRALLQYPSMLRILLDRCGVEADRAVLSHSIFKQYPSGGLEQLLNLYAGRCFPCWKDPAVIAWLQTNTHTLMEKLNNGEEIGVRRQTEEYYKGTPLNILRHIVLAGIKDVPLLPPPGISSSSILSYDPLPPPDAVQTYSKPKPRRLAVSEGHGSGSLSAFFRSIMPTFDPEQDLQNQANAQAGNQLQEGVGNVLGMLRDLLNNIHIQPPPREDGNVLDDEGELGRNQEGRRDRLGEPDFD